MQHVQAQGMEFELENLFAKENSKVLPRTDNIYKTQAWQKESRQQKTSTQW